ncbi:condensation domain-containing protein [Gordonia sp. ABSL11-1]|uniref:condensation domain-containing protein n=1 Tax=Gordonia sp. ABSL11-1 TaxID=3053924 RepID=UPI0025727E5A|nr:condensation domain-containing protein [Gordonia sp. ABSL11-1]MDL9945836.1 condensation domain-containing protein [Gordonia sp. ABSL11-1]
MKFTELSDYDLPGGTVTEWTPVADVDPSHWDADARPLTYEHEDHIIRAARARDRGDAESSWLGAVFAIDRNLDPTAMERALLSWVRRHEAFRTTVSLVDAASGVGVIRRTCGAESISIRRRPARIVGADSIHAHLVDTFDGRLSPLVWPPCMVMTISDTDRSPADDGFLLVFAADHSVMDAYSMFLSINELRTLYDAELDGCEDGLPPTGSHVDFSSGNRRSGEELTENHPGVERWRRLLDATGGRLPTLGLPLREPLTAISPPADIVRESDDRQHGWADVVATAGQMDALGTMCRANGHSTQTAVIATLALANQELTGNARLRAVMPMHTRHEAQFVESVGWYVGLGPLEVDLTGAETISDALSAAAAGIAEAKRTSRLPYPRIAQLLGTSAEPEFVVSYLDLRFVPGASNWPRWRAQTLRGTSRSTTEVYLWIARTPTGLTVSTRHPGTATAAANVRLLIDTAAAIVASVLTGPPGRSGAMFDPDSLTAGAQRQPA